jgi:hypothetical protein
MVATLAERSAVPFHLGLTEPIDETAIADFPTLEGGYDPVDQIWRLPSGTPLTDPEASIEGGPHETPTLCRGTVGFEMDDIDFEY